MTKFLTSVTGCKPAHIVLLSSTDNRITAPTPIQKGQYGKKTENNKGKEAPSRKLFFLPCGCPLFLGVFPVMMK